LIATTIERMRLRELLAEQVACSGREAVGPVDVLLLLAVNLAVARDPLYELGGWVDSLDLRPLGFADRPRAHFTDDRFARALDKLYEADRASLQTRLALAILEVFDVKLDQLHNDSTTVKACGRIPGTTASGLELRRGHSKDHRPDLKQLLFTLTISADGAVPIHHRVYSGNRNDATTHIESWECLRALHGRPDFLYVADCKLCTRPQLDHLAARGGRAITVLPRNYLEARAFTDALRAAPRAKKLIWRRSKPGDETTAEYFYLFEGQYRMEQGGYPLYWYGSSEKRQRDRQFRLERLRTAEKALDELAPKLHTPRLSTQAAIRKAYHAILDRYEMHEYLDVRIRTHLERWRTRPRGRPPRVAGRLRVIRQRAWYSLHWARRTEALARQRRVDGVFPLLCTDPTLAPKAVLQAWKYQPRLEKRFEQFKHVHRAAPLLFKKIQRVEAMMFVFFIALMIQALLERAVRQGLEHRQAPPLKLYPEERDAPHATTSQILKTFAGLSTYVLSQDGQSVEAFRDPLSETHRAVLNLLQIDEEAFWSGRRTLEIGAKTAPPSCGM
jgi:transposase